MQHWVLGILFCTAVPVLSCQGGCNTDATVGGVRRTDSGSSSVDGGSPVGDGGSNGADAGDDDTKISVGPGSFSLDGGLSVSADGVGLNPDGHIILNSNSQEFHFMWIANNGMGWVSKYDTKTGNEVGRYWSIIPKDCANSSGPPCLGGAANGLVGNAGNMPSRTAVDLFGDVWVANRANGIQGSVTKIANDQSDCIDRNGDGKITTSRDVNGDGIISSNPADGEMVTPSSSWSDPLQYDECVLFTTPIGSPGSGVAGRALAISLGFEGSAGDVWYGDFRERRMYKLNAANGQPIAVNSSGLTYVQLQNFEGPYGAVIDGQQRLWVVAITKAHLALIDTKAGTVVTTAILPPSGTTCGGYGLAIDSKDRVWLPGMYSGPRACRYDHGPGVSSALGTWTSFNFSSARTPTGVSLGRPRGIAVDDEGNVYMSTDSNSTSNRAQLIRFDAETGALKPFAGASGAIEIVDATDSVTNISIGVGLDAEGHPWINNYSGNVMRIHKQTGEVLRTPSQSAGLYTYSDFTGYQLRKFTAPRGTYRRDFEGCSDGTWRTLRWSASTPTNTSVSVYVRAADEEADLAGATRIGPLGTSPADLQAAGVPNSRFLRVEFVLSSTDGISTPVLTSFDLDWTCENSLK